jgi:arabinogalactan endo-1,4-beta-galactosidase
MDENDFDTAVSDAAGDISVDNNTKTAEHILSHSLFQDFEAELAQRDEPEALQAHDDYDPDQFQTEIWDHTLEVFATLSAEGTL